MFPVMFAERCFSDIVHNLLKTSPASELSIFLHQTLRVAGVSQFACVQLYGFHKLFSDCDCSLYLKITLDFNIWWSVPQFGLQRNCSCATNVHLIPGNLGDAEVYHMPMSRSGMRPGGLVCILLFEHDVGHYQIELIA